MIYDSHLMLCDDVHHWLQQLLIQNSLRENLAEKINKKGTGESACPLLLRSSWRANNAYQVWTLNHLYLLCPYYPTSPDSLRLLTLTENLGKFEVVVRLLLRILGNNVIFIWNPKYLGVLTLIENQGNNVKWFMGQTWYLKTPFMGMLEISSSMLEEVYKLLTFCIILT